MCIESCNEDYYFSYNTLNENYLWNKISSEIANIKTYKNVFNNDYSCSENEKIEIYLKIANDIVNDIVVHINPNEKTLIAIEGYSYYKNSFEIIDLVSIGTTIRIKILENIKNIKEIKIIPPKSLKLNVCEMVYGFKYVHVGKKRDKVVKVINESFDGKKGGNFDKNDIYKALMNYSDSKLKKFYIDKKDKIEALKNIPKPLEDINDAYFLKETIKYQTNKCI